MSDELCSVCKHPESKHADGGCMMPLETSGNERDGYTISICGCVTTKVAIGKLTSHIAYLQDDNERLRGLLIELVAACDEDVDTRIPLVLEDRVRKELGE